MTTKTLIITPQGTAKEINPLIKPKEWKVSPTTQDFIERKEYKQMEDSLKEYKIVGCYILHGQSNTITDWNYKDRRFDVLKEIAYAPGTIYSCEVNEDDKTCIIL